MEPLIAAAFAARRNAHAPYSKFFVGAALEDANGAVHTGCNVENSSYGLTVCAERVAVFKAISSGVPARSFRRIVVATDAPALTPPCGACRQVLQDLCGGNLEVILANLSGGRETYSLRQLYPHPFDPDSL